MVKTSTIEKDGTGCGLMFMGFFFVFFFKKHRQIERTGLKVFGSLTSNVKTNRVRKENDRDGERERRREGVRERRREGVTERGRDGETERRREGERE